LKNLSNKLIDYLQNQNHINPNFCQIRAVTEIEKRLSKNLTQKIISYFINKLEGIYLHGSVGVGKSIILKAVNVLYKNSEIFHFSDLIFHIQNSKEKKKSNFLEKQKVILIDEFSINNLTNIILFRKFLKEASFKKKIIIMTGNKEITNIYNDPVNENVCKEIRLFLSENFTQIKMKSKVDYRSKENVNNNFFFIKKKNFSFSQNKLIKQIATTSRPRDLIIKKRGYTFSIKNYYGNLLDIEFKNFFQKKLIFQDFVIISKKVNFLILRDIPKLYEGDKDKIYRFISFVDALYENNNVLSISTRVELENIYNGKSNSFEFKRTLSRLKEMGSNTYITKNLKKFIKK